MAKLDQNDVQALRRMDKREILTVEKTVRSLKSTNLKRRANRVVVGWFFRAAAVCEVSVVFCDLFAPIVLRRAYGCLSVVCIVLGVRGELGLREQCGRCVRCLGMLVLVGKDLGPGSVRSSG